MIDTIVLVLRNNMFAILEPDRFTPSARSVLDPNLSLGGRAFVVAKQNPIKGGPYGPRLSLTNRLNDASGLREPTLKIELSLPKLKYGNNFDELVDEDFELIVDKLQKTLSSMGVKAFTDVLRIAPVSTVHYSKNIPLTDGRTPSYYIKKIRESNAKLFLDVEEGKYKNEGPCYRWFCNSYAIVFYDKIKELKSASTTEKGNLE